MSKGKGLGQMQHSYNNMFLETATMPPNVKDILNRRGDAIVNSIKIGRTPVQSAIQGILKTLSTVPYDNLFHLFMIFKTSKGEILFEKNARINASTTIPKSEDWYDLNDVPKMTLNDYIQNTKKFMGAKFFPYHPNTNNCQDFISGVLQANGIRDQNVYNFVKQDTSMIFKDKGWLSGLAKQVTDLGGYADVVMQGGVIISCLTSCPCYATVRSTAGLLIANVMQLSDHLLIALLPMLCNSGITSPYSKCYAAVCSSATSFFANVMQQWDDLLLPLLSMFCNKGGNLQLALLAMLCNIGIICRLFCWQCYATLV